MRFLVMGAGSIGSVVGGLLHRGGNQVFLLGKGPHIEAVVDRGLRISGIWGDHYLPDIAASDSVQDAVDRGFEPQWTILSVKSYDTSTAMEDLEPVLQAQKGVISLQNGLGNLESVQRAAPGKVVGGRVIFGARTLEPGRVDVTVCADDVLLGPAFEGPRGVEDVCATFSECRIPCRFEARIVSFIWDKVLYNVCLNALATLLETDYGSLGDDPDTLSIMEKLVNETYLVAQAEGVEMVSPDPRSYMERFERELLPPTRQHRSSMQEDVRHHRRTEIEALNGSICRMAREHGIQAPFNEALAGMIRFLEKARGQA